MPKLSDLLPSHAQGETTRLNPREEHQFQLWAKDNGIDDANDPRSFYDYRGYWREFGGEPIVFGVDHFTDTYKQHGHPVFSSESRYSRGLQDGGQWLGEVLIPPPTRSR